MFNKKSRRDKTLAAVATAVNAALPKKEKPSHKKRNTVVGLGLAGAALLAGSFIKDQDDRP